MHVAEWSDACLRPSPHTLYHPLHLLAEEMQRLLARKSGEIMIPRPLFAQSWWLLHHLAKDRATSLSLSVDNKTFPIEITFSPRTDRRCKVMAMTRFLELSALTLLAEEAPWHMVCDGLIIL